MAWLRENYQNKDIFNDEETALFYKFLSNKILKINGKNCNAKNA